MAFFLSNTRIDNIYTTPQFSSNNCSHLILNIYLTIVFAQENLAITCNNVSTLLVSHVFCGVLEHV